MANQWAEAGSAREFEMRIVDGSDHTFSSRPREQVLIREAVTWLERRFGPGYPRAWQGPPPARDVAPPARAEGIDVQELGRAMVSVPGVREVHDLHVWTVTSGFPALAAHVRTDPNDNAEEVRERLEAVLHERFGLDHTTLQVVPEPLLQLEDRRPRRD